MIRSSPNFDQQGPGMGHDQKTRERVITAPNSIRKNILQIKLKYEIKIQEISNKTKVKNVWVAIKKLKWKYAGYVIREAPHKWNETLTTWNTYEGKRRRGRLAKRWVDKIQQNLDPQWVRIARTGSNGRI